MLFLKECKRTSPEEGTDEFCGNSVVWVASAWALPCFQDGVASVCFKRLKISFSRF